MTDDRIKLQVLTPEQAVLAEEVDEVVLPGEEGELGVKPGHDPLLTSLGIGEMVVSTDGEKRRFFVDRGFAEVFARQVRVLAEDCEGVEEIDVQQAREKLAEAEQEIERLESAESEEDELLDSYRESLKKQRRRLALSGEDDES
ncbi:MAG: ATP synthase F1 subunit epsilon [Bradymonadaceae bacterium]